MIKGKQVQPKAFLDRPDVNYRKLDALNQSMIKLFDTDPVKFFEEFKRGRPRKQKKNTALIIGDLVDFYLLECKGIEKEFDDRLDEKFALYNGVKGTGQVFILADYLFEETEACINEFGEVTCSFATRFADAVRRVRADEKYKGKDDDKILEDFEKNGKEYFDSLLKNLGKTVVDVSLVDKAKMVAHKLKKDPFTQHIFMGSDEHEFVTHFPIEFNWNLDENSFIGCKAELDMMLINHDDKTIQPMDLKTTYDNESFDMMYIKNSYYLQNAFYCVAAKKWAEANGMKEYDVKPMTFVVGDTSSNNRRPLVYKTSLRDLHKGLAGFSRRGVYYRGVNELIHDIAWAEQNNEWSCSREAFKNGGQMTLKIDYDE